MHRDCGCKYDLKKLVCLNDIFPCIIKISSNLSHDLDSTMGPNGCVGLLLTFVRDFATYVHPMWNVLQLIYNKTHEAKLYKKIGLPLCMMFYYFLAKIESSLRLLGSEDKK